MDNCLRISHWLLLSLVMVMAVSMARADGMITREYRLKYADIADVSRVLNMAVKNASGNRIIGGEGKRCVITDTAENQDSIAELLPVIDQPTKETVAFARQREMLGHISSFYYDQKKGRQDTQHSPAPTSSTARMSSAGVSTYDKKTSTQPYKSVYSSEDAELMKKPRVITEEPHLPSLSALTLKGIFEVGRGSRVALMVYGGVSYTARDGGLFERNHARIKDVRSQVFKDRVILMGPDRIPREIKFISTL